MAKPTIASLHRRLTIEFNRFIRLRDTETLKDGSRWGTCISCGQALAIEKANAGHFIPAKNYATRYNEANVNLQCVLCNKYKHGNPFGYVLGIRDLYGEEMVFSLCEQMHLKKKYTSEVLLEMIALYKVKQEGVK